MDKRAEYRKLISDVKGCAANGTCSDNCKGISLEGCPFCDEINLWGYWQGGESHLDADILLVGQDWGNYNDTKCKELLQRIKQKNNDSRYCLDYMQKNENSTDKNLCELFKSIGENVRKDNPRVFFTNYVLCYRAGNSSISGGFKQKWGNNCSPFFERLVRIIKPNVIICLGRAVYYNVLKTAKMKCQRGKYNDIITGGFVTADFGGHRCNVFPVAHCGALGTANRNKGSYFKELELQKQDWARIKANI